MDFLDPKKRKAHRRQLFLGYGLIAIALVFATTVLLYQAYGYDYDPTTGEVTQNGFVFVDASPVEANIFLNGKGYGLTDTRIDTVAGDYTLELQQDGYRSWKKDFSLEGRKIERLTYPFLFPATLKTSEVQLYASRPDFLSQSPDRRWLLSNQPGSIQNYDLTDDNVETPTAVTISLPAGLLRSTGSSHAIEPVEWSTDNRHVLLKHTFSGGQEFFVMDTQQPAASVNLSNKIPTTFTSVTMRDKKFDQYYLLNANDGSLTTASLDNPAPNAYLSNVLAYQSHGSDVMVFATTADAEADHVWLKIREGDDVYNLRQVTASERYLLDIARFENNWYVAVGSAQDQRVYIFKNPVAVIKRDTDRSPVPSAALRTTKQPMFISFSANARFIAVQAGSEFSVYDAETDRQYRYDTRLEVEDANKALWMDGHRLALVSKEKVVVFDFDGTNSQELSRALPNAKVFFNQGWESLFTLAPSEVVTGRIVVASTSLRAE